jgi:hypothetical protein
MTVSALCAALNSAVVCQCQHCVLLWTALPYVSVSTVCCSEQRCSMSGSALCASLNSAAVCQCPQSVLHWTALPCSVRTKQPLSDAVTDSSSYIDRVSVRWCTALAVIIYMVRQQHTFCVLCTLSCSTTPVTVLLTCHVTLHRACWLTANSYCSIRYILSITIHTALLFPNIYIYNFPLTLIWSLYKFTHISWCLNCAMFSLEPLAQDPRDSEITDMRYVNVFTPLPLPCSALTAAWQPCCGDHSVWIVWGVYFGKIRFDTGGKILFRSVLRRGQRVRAGCTCYICVLVVL